jgi:hypothetical protein
VVGWVWDILDQWTQGSNLMADIWDLLNLQNIEEVGVEMQVDME